MMPDIWFSESAHICHIHQNFGTRTWSLKAILKYLLNLAFPNKNAEASDDSLDQLQIFVFDQDSYFWKSAIWCLQVI